jgi:integrase
MRKDQYIPRPTRHAKGSAVVRLNGQDFYLGAFGSPAAKAAYETLIAEWLANGRQLPRSPRTINEIILAYLKHAEEYYRQSPKERDRIRMAVGPLKQLFGRTPAEEFGPLRLKAVRDKFLATQKRTFSRLVSVGGKPVRQEKSKEYRLARRTINQRIGVIKRMFKWAVENELVLPHIHHGLEAVAGLKEGRSSAKETAPVRPATDPQVDAVLGVVNRHLGTMIQLQRLTGARSGEIVIMRATDIDQSRTVGDVPLWIYRPPKHKNAYRGQSREIFLGPKAQELLRPFLVGDPCGFLFSPRKAMAERYEEQRKKRKSRVQPSQLCRKKAKPKKKPGERYTVYSFRQAIATACNRAKIETWHPHQLRHAAATRIRKTYGVEMARIILGHATAFTTEIYAEADQQQAMTVMTRIG